jgi:hypothetical protein
MAIDTRARRVVSGMVTKGVGTGEPPAPWCSTARHRAQKNGRSPVERFRSFYVVWQVTTISLFRRRNLVIFRKLLRRSETKTVRPGRMCILLEIKVVMNGF